MSALRAKRELSAFLSGLRAVHDELAKQAADESALAELRPRVEALRAEEAELAPRVAELRREAAELEPRAKAAKSYIENMRARFQND